MNPRDLLRQAERDGWNITRTNGGHIRLDHPEAPAPVFAASTPSDHRAIRNMLADLRRALPRTPKTPPAVEYRKLGPRKRKPKPSPPPKPKPLPARPPRPRPTLPGAPAGFVTTRWPTS